jgi:conjugal transfer pilus assembly protein TraV
MMARTKAKQAASAVMMAAFALLAGCSMFHDNVKGGFQCQAPRGVCAPSSSIDDAALAQIGGGRADGDMAPASDMTPASDLGLAGAMDINSKHPVRSAKHARRRDVQPGFAGASRPALRIVHLAWRDGQGRMHARTTDYVYVDAAPVPNSDAPPVDYVADRDGAADRSLLGVAERAPEIGGISMATSPAPPPAPVVGLMPSAMPLGVAPSAALAPNPTEAIRAKVAAILAKAPKPMATMPLGPMPPTSAPVASSEAPSTHQSGGIFPPAGS